MSILTLARFILEFSLMDFETVMLSESKLASAALFMALRMTNIIDCWDKTLEYYTGNRFGEAFKNTMIYNEFSSLGYELKDFAKVVVVLNAGLHQKPRETIKTVRNKYMHKIFFEVAKVPLKSNDKLFETTGISYVNNDVSIKV